MSSFLIPWMISCAAAYRVRACAGYVLLKLLRLFVTVNEPSCCAVTLIQ